MNCTNKLENARAILKYSLKVEWEIMFNKIYIIALCEVHCVAKSMWTPDDHTVLNILFKIECII